jgi:hypothetical protein
VQPSPRTRQLISGLTTASIASRARKIRDRTVPIGQSIASAISS